MDPNRMLRLCWGCGRSSRSWEGPWPRPPLHQEWPAEAGLDPLTQEFLASPAREAGTTSGSLAREQEGKGRGAASLPPHSPPGCSPGSARPHPYPET